MVYQCGFATRRSAAGVSGMGNAYENNSNQFALLMNPQRRCGRMERMWANVQTLHRLFLVALLVIGC
jgi:hypothetical protein